jgi:hypothetical protein
MSNNTIVWYENSDDLGLDLRNFERMSFQYGYLLHGWEICIALMYGSALLRQTCQVLGML